MMLLNSFLFIIGLVFGSFITALSYRYLRGISNIKGRSFCDNCKKQIAWYDNIPLLSYIFLNGRCRNCRSKISLRYPLIELATGLGFVFIFTFKGESFQGFSLQNVYSAVIFCILEIIFIIDWENQIIPDTFIFIGMLIAIFSSQLTQPASLPIFNSLFAGMICAVFLLLIFLFTKGRGMGLGDVKFAVLGGMIVGLPLTYVWLFLAFLTGAVVGIILILSKKAGLKSKIAFGPFLIISIPITLLWGQKIIDIMLSH